MTDDVTLRQGIADDASCIGALGAQVFLDTYAKTGIRPALAREVESHFGRDAVRERLMQPSRKLLLAEHGTHLVGFSEIVLGARHELVASQRTAELARLYVQTPFLRRGVGRLLLRQSEALARSSGADTLWLTAWVGNERALAFYARQGYERLGSSDYVFENEAFENILFAKALDSTS